MKGKLHRRPRQETDLMLAISVLVDDCRALPTEPLAPVCCGSGVEEVSARKKRHNTTLGNEEPRRAYRGQFAPVRGLHLGPVRRNDLLRLCFRLLHAVDACCDMARAHGHIGGGKIGDCAIACGHHPHRNETHPFWHPARAGSPSSRLPSAGSWSPGRRECAGGRGVATCWRGKKWSGCGTM